MLTGSTAALRPHERMMRTSRGSACHAGSVTRFAAACAASHRTSIRVRCSSLPSSSAPPHVSHVQRPAAGCAGGDSAVRAGWARLPRCPLVDAGRTPRLRGGLGSLASMLPQSVSSAGRLADEACRSYSPWASMPRRRAAPSAACVSARTTCSRARAPAAASRGGRIAACAPRTQVFGNFGAPKSPKGSAGLGADVAARAAHGRAAALGARGVGRRERRDAGYRADPVRMRRRARRSRPSCNCRASQRTTRARRHTACSWRRAKAGVGSAATGGRGHREDSSAARSRASFSRCARRSRAPSVPDATCRARRPNKPGRRCGQDPGESGSCAGWGAVGPGRRFLAGPATAVLIASL